MALISKSIHKMLVVFTLFVAPVLSSFAQANDSVEQFLVSEFQKISQEKTEKALATDADLVIQKIDSVKTATATDIIPEYSDKGLTFKFVYSPEALKKPELFLRELMVAAGLAKRYEHPHFKVMWEYDILTKVSVSHINAELLFNARMGSPSAQVLWRELQLLFFERAEVSEGVLKKLGISSEFVKNTMQELSEEIRRLEPVALAHEREQKRKLEKWRKTTGVLDKLEREQEKLNHLILKNDRVGVKRLLEAYLPWAVMEPFEVNSWRSWLEAIEKPNPQKGVVAFRGLDYETDKVQRLKTEKGEALGMMSTVLTKNQGNYTRRLRSLSVNRRTNGDSDTAIGLTKVLSVSVLHQMKEHAGDPKASNFLSFTINPETARNFIGLEDYMKHKPTGGLLAVKIDQRRLFPNMASSFPLEVEMLAPLIVFPDEVVKYQEGNVSDQDLKLFLKEVYEKTGVQFDVGKHNSAVINSKAHHYNKKAYEFLKDLSQRNPRALMCGGIFN